MSALYLPYSSPGTSAGTDHRAGSSGRPSVERVAFRAMGSDCLVIVVGGPPGTARRALDRVAELEAKWSRFLVDSEISRLNAAGGRPVAVSADTHRLISRALDAWQLTGGVYDATMLGAVEGAGYDRSFELLSDSNGFSVRPRRPFGGGPDMVTVRGRTVALEGGVGFDPGGIGKGLAADLVVSMVMDEGARGVCVNLGGDLRVAGTSPDGGSWTVAVEHPWAPVPVALLGLAAGAVATSTTLRRVWPRDGKVQHHLIDPSTGRPSASDVNLATVVGTEGWAAEVLAKAVLLRGAEHFFDVLAGTGAEGLVVDSDGWVHTSPGLAAFTGGQGVTERVDAARATDLLPMGGGSSER